VLQSANITATWSGPPTAEEIRAQDRQRLLDHPALSATPSEDDLSLARQIVERLLPEQIASALIGLLRADLPDPEDVSDDARMRDAPSMPMRDRERTPRVRAERGFVESEGDGAWFRLNVGRRRNADPKWLVPLICRLGHITKAEIGPIRVFEDETRFEIVSHAADAFAIAAQETLEDNIQITPSSAPQRGGVYPRRDEDQAPREPRPPREARRPREVRPPREARPPRAHREPRHDARQLERERRAEARARIEADPVFASLAASDRPAPASDGMNRRQRRDAARAAGILPAAAPPGNETVKRRWTPDSAGIAPKAKPDEARASRQERPHGDRRGRPAHGDKPGNFKPCGFKPRGPKPAGGRPYRGKPGGGKPKRDRRG
jgi:ATP-dependent RNA helicase DeaD